MKANFWMSMAMISLTSCQHAGSQYLTEDDIPEFIEAHLIQQYAQTNGLTSAKLPVEVVLEDGIKQIYMDTLKESVSYFIPTSRDYFLYGDLTGNQQEDVVVGVRNVCGVNQDKEIFFLFTGYNDRLSYVRTFESTLLADCSSIGRYPPKLKFVKIAENRLYGTSICYGPEDAPCCPSLAHETIFVYDSATKELVVQSE